MAKGKRWRKNTKETGLAAVGAGPRGETLVSTVDKDKWFGSVSAKRDCGLPVYPTVWEAWVYASPRNLMIGSAANIDEAKAMVEAAVAQQ